MQDGAGLGGIVNPTSGELEREWASQIMDQAFQEQGDDLAIQCSGDATTKKMSTSVMRSRPPMARVAGVLDVAAGELRRS